MYFVHKNQEVFGYYQISKLVDIAQTSIQTRVNHAIRKNQFYIIVRNEKIFFNKVSQKENLHHKLQPATTFHRYQKDPLKSCDNALDLVLEKCKKGHILMTYSFETFLKKYPESVLISK